MYHNDTVVEYLNTLYFKTSWNIEADNLKQQKIYNRKIYVYNLFI